MGQACALTGRKSPSFHDAAGVLSEEFRRPLCYEPVSLTRHLRHLLVGAGS